MASLKDLVQQRVDGQWNEWAQRHPNLAAAIYRVELVQTTVSRLRDDPSYVQAMQEARLDENQLLAAKGVLDIVERLVGRTIPF